ncbi:S-adenosyl-L-methionine-dependent methyltransferase [Scenedesmus sp. NREL 46B-D3]|nr:S-adenosyl-L-methionine-dependent methyltransferase [Scenedesmus sp. NREL 46B-D3]
MFGLAYSRFITRRRKDLQHAYAACWPLHQLQKQRPHADFHTSSSSSTVAKEPETPLLQTLKQRIMIRGGPLSVADYMQEVLTNPCSGYYMKRDVFGSSGDFTTSPEISQMFGEMTPAAAAAAAAAAGCATISPEESQMFEELGQPRQLSLVELGPGRGTLLADLLRGTAAFRPFAQALQVHLVEVSPFLRQQQWEKLHCSTGRSCGDDASSTNGGSSSSGDEQQQQQQEHSFSSGVSGLNGAEVHWHACLDAVPSSGPAIYVAHEFLDALPVHQFVRDAHRGWLEVAGAEDRAWVMVDTADSQQSDDLQLVNSSNSSSSPEGVPLVQQQQQQQQQQLIIPPGHIPQQQQQQAQQGSYASTQQQQQQQQPGADQQDLHLRFVLSPSPTPASQLLVPRRLAALQQQQQTAVSEAVEVGAHAMAVCETLARRIAGSGGAALLVDYGRNAPYTNSLTAIRAHAGVHPLSQPGTADLSAWVDFSAMRMAAEQAAEAEQASAAAAAGNSGSASAAKAASAAAGAAGVDVHGPVPQADLLHSLGIQHRLEALSQAISALVDTSPGGMGGAYLAMAITQKGLQAPVGFEQQQPQQQD